MNKDANTLESKDNYAESSALLSDIVMNYKTIISFGEKNIDYLMAYYNGLLELPNSAGFKNAHIGGVLFGYSQFIRFIFIGFIFYIASKFINRYGDN